MFCVPPSRDRGVQFRLRLVGDAQRGLTGQITIL
jgi:hypothetical protein